MPVTCNLIRLFYSETLFILSLSNYSTIFYFTLSYNANDRTLTNDGYLKQNGNNYGIDNDTSSL